MARSGFSMGHSKEAALPQYLDMIRKSWTWAKLSTKEREQFTKVAVDAVLKGDYLARWQILNNMYSAFLSALDYEPINWRETAEERENNPRF